MPTTPTVEQFTDPYVTAYTPPPTAGPGVCDVCHGAPRAGYRRCWSCSEAMRTVTRPLDLVVPISLYRVGEQLHTVLAGYKRSPDAAVRERFLLRVAATLHRFLWLHGSHVEAAAGATWDTVTIVPSKTTRTGDHPLTRAIRLGRPLADRYADLLAADRPDQITRAHGSDNGYRTITDVKDRRVLLIDDTFTSGATLQSAASRLRLDGAHVVAGIPIGRVMNPDFNDETKLLWDRQRGVPFDFSTCCLEEEWSPHV